MKAPLVIVALSLFLGPVAGCDGEEKKSIADQIGPATKNSTDVKPTSKVSEEELQKRRKEAGFKTKEEVDNQLAAENAKMFEKGEREFVKARLKDYRKIVADTRKLLDDVEKEASKWSTAKDPQKAFAKTGEALGKRAKDIQKALDKLTEKGIKGGNTQATLNKAYRPLEELGGALGPALAKEPAFAETLKNIRAALGEADTAFADIEKDESLVASKFAKAGEEGAAAEGEEGAAPANDKTRAGKK